MRTHLARIKADILCELVAVSVIRSEFEAADKVDLLSSILPQTLTSFQELDVLIAHTRTWDVFDEFSARIALHHAHLAHSVGKSSQASGYYAVASALSEPSSFVDIAATLGRAQLFIGLSAYYPSPPAHGSEESVEKTSMPANVNNDELLAFASRAVRLTKGMGGTLEAAGKVIQAATTTEILRAKWGFVSYLLLFRLILSDRQYLKDGLSKASKSQDNHLRALIMALVSSHYFHTAYDQAEQVLSTCEQLAVGLGAPTEKVDSNQALTFGNIQLGVWVSERTLGLQLILLYLTWLLITPLKSCTVGVVRWICCRNKKRKSRFSGTRLGLYKETNSLVP